MKILYLRIYISSLFLVSFSPLSFTIHNEQLTVGNEFLHTFVFFRNLACFVFLYKLLELFFRTVNVDPFAAEIRHRFFLAFIAAWSKKKLKQRFLLHTSSRRLLLMNKNPASECLFLIIRNDERVHRSSFCKLLFEIYRFFFDEDGHKGPMPLPHRFHSEA